MFRWSSAMKAKALFQADKERHLADIAVLKSDAMGATGRPAVLKALAELPTLDASTQDLAALGMLPEGSFGRAYADFMSANGLSPFVLSGVVEDEIVRRNAFTVRYAATHDLFHVLLGFDTSWPGELGVLAFAVAQRYAPFQRVAAAMAFVIYPFLSGFRLGALVRAWNRGYRMGAASRALLLLPLESFFDRDLAGLRQELGLSDPPHRETV